MIDRDGQRSLPSFKDCIPYSFGQDCSSLPAIEAAEIRMIAQMEAFVRHRALLPRVLFVVQLDTTR